MPTELLYERIQSFLNQVLGDRVARHLIISYCARKNKQPKEIDEQDLPELGKYFHKNLQLFVGSQNAKIVLHHFVTMLSSSDINNER
mgnify:FL=1